MKHLFVGLVVVVAVLTGCSDDESNSVTGPSTSTSSDITVQMTAMDPHVGQLVEMSLVNDASNQLIARAVLDPLTSASATVELPNAGSATTRRLDFFADFNQNSQYDAPPTDHAWRLAVPSSGVVSFTHNASFTNIASPAIIPRDDNFEMNFTGFTPHIGQLLEIRVIDATSRSTVGVYRLGTVPSDNFSLRIDDIITDGTRYQVDFYADLNQNGSYNAPPVDHAWRVMATATTDGLNINFNHNASFTDVGF